MSDVRRVLGMPAKQGLTSTYSDHVAEEESRGRRFGQLLKEHREAKGLKQEEAAEKSGVHLSTYSRWERGIVRNPIPEDIRAVCEAVGLSTITANVVLGSVAPEEAERLPEPPRRFDPRVEKAIAILEDDAMDDDTRQSALDYLEFLRARPGMRQPGTDKDQSRAAS